MCSSDLNIIREFSHSTGEVLDSIEEEKTKLVLDEENLRQEKARLEAKRDELIEVLGLKLKLKQEQEAYLESLNDEKDQYQAQLNELEKSWDELKILFAEISNEFPKIIQNGNISMEDLNLSFTFTSIKGSISEGKVNEIVKTNPNLPEMVFDFTEDDVKIELPEKRLILMGTI